MRPNTNPLKIHPDSLTSLRFFAVMLIVAHHLRQPFFPHLLKDERFDNAGVLGVTFFLFLSGFILPLNYGRCRSLKEYACFLWNRIVRIYPVHIFTFILSFIILILNHNPINPSIAVINILLLQAYLPYQQIFFSFNSVSWILSTLFLFYLVFPVINQQRKCLVWTMIFSIACLIISMAFIETSQTKLTLWLLYIFPPNRLAVCLAGVIGSSLFFIISLRYRYSLGNCALYV
jgi:peptidoglycan/LPS O-acetylase OafA/YrhL